MIEIKKEILDKYQMDNIDHYINGFGEKEGTLAFCRAFLKLTDHVPLKVMENHIESMVVENVSVGNMKKFFADAKGEYGEVLTARKAAREEINRIESEAATE